MGSPQSSLARHPDLSQYAIVTDATDGTATVYLVEGDVYSGHSFTSLRAAKQWRKAAHPDAREVPAHWVTPVALAKPAAPADDLVVVDEAPLVSMHVGLRFTNGTTTVYTATHHDGSWWHFAGNDGDVLRYTEEDCRRHFALGMWTLVAKPAAPDPFADVRAAGHVWGKIDATNDRPDDSHKAYCWRFPAEAQSTAPPPGHAEAFRGAYDDAFAAEMRGRRGGK